MSFGLAAFFSQMTQRPRLGDQLAQITRESLGTNRPYPNPHQLLNANLIWPSPSDNAFWERTPGGDSPDSFYHRYMGLFQRIPQNCKEAAQTGDSQASIGWIPVGPRGVTSQEKKMDCLYLAHFLRSAAFAEKLKSEGMEGIQLSAVPFDAEEPHGDPNFCQIGAHWKV